MKSEKHLKQWIRIALVRVSVVLILVTILLTNLGITWIFNEYVHKVRDNQVGNMIELTSESLVDGVLTADERSSLRQLVNQMKGVLILKDMKGAEVFDSLVSGNGNQRPLLNKQSELVDPDTIEYKQYLFISGGNTYTAYFGFVESHILGETDFAFILGVNMTMVIVLILAIPVVWLLSKQLAQKLSDPMLGICKAAEEIKKGNYTSHQLQKSDAIELSELAKSIESLGIQLNQQEEIRKRMTTDMAHELRSPLAVLRSQMEGMADGVIDVTPERLYRLNDEVMRLTNLIDHLNELTRVENDLYRLNLEKVDASVLMEELVLNHKPLFEEKGLQLTCDLAPHMLIEADSERLRQIIGNLISNAYKYTDEGLVKLVMGEVNHQIVIEVKDTGIGIEKSDLPFIFQRFYRVDPSRSRETGGAGIGLAIVKKLVLAHGWKIEAESEMGKGTTIKIFITSS